MKQFRKKTTNSIICMLICVLLSSLFFISCDDDTRVDFLEEHSLFNLSYGNFENEIGLFNVQNADTINTRHIMRDGFFYIVNGEAGKIMQLTSYGDLIGIMYDEERNPTPTFVTENSAELSALVAREDTSTKIATSYPFNRLGAMAIDSTKNLYVTDFLPIERYEEDADSGTILRQVILRFAPDGTFVDFLAQDGLGGQPFPFIKALYTTNNNELVAVCLDTKGYILFWFSQEGQLLTKVSFDKSMLPEEALDYALETYVTLENIIPDYEDATVYLKADYYGLKVDDSTNVSSGIEYEKTIVYPFDMRTLTYGDPITVPPYERTTSHGYATETFLHPYSFLGVSESGGLFFLLPDDTGLSILVTHENSQRIIRRQIEIPLGESIFQSFSLSNNGIISGLIAREEEISVSWWRTDNIVNSIIE